jgi:NitT/TauT family transport system substrate-binding protein
MYLLKPIESGSDVKITGGVHTGCLRLQVAKDSGLTVDQLKGKRIGIPTHIGSPPFLFASRVLAAKGIDPRPAPEGKEVKWLPYPPGELALALEKHQVDAVATADPIGTILEGKGLVKTIADQATDQPYADEYCCASVVSGKLARKHPQTAARVTRAILKAARWVQENPAEAARMGVEKEYVASTPEINAQALMKLKYIPGIARCRTSIDNAAQEMKKAGLLNEDTDPAELAKRAWIDLDGVTDDWIATLKVEKVALAPRPRLLNAREFAALFEDRKMCCACCCLD